MYWVFTFPTTHLALKFDQVTKEEKRNVKLIPLPREIGASCGFCGKITDKEEIDRIIEMCNNHGIEFEHIYEIPEDKKKKPEVYI